jgi:hypothetical protein
MRFAIQLGLILAGVAALGIALAFIRGVPEVVSLWPYSSTYGLSKVFIASMFAAIGAPIIWIGISGDLAAVRSGAINIIAVGVGLAGQATWKIGFEASSQPLMIFAIAVWVVVVAMGVTIVLARNERWRDPRPTPWLVRIAFGLFTFVLLVAGGLLVQRIQIFPWVLDRDAALTYGIMFLGAAAYFIYGLVEPVWSNAKGQLLGFLAYDAVLIAPYLNLWPSTEGQQQTALTVYLAVLVFSGAIALWFLFFNPIWKFGRGQGTQVRNWRRRARNPTGDDGPIAMDSSLTSL